MSISARLHNFFFKRRLKKSVLQFPLRRRLHGVKSVDRQGALLQSKAGDELQFVHVPLKAYPHNTYAYSVSLNRVLGYLDEDTAKTLLYVFGQGFCLDGEIKELIGGEPYKYVGCIVRIFDGKSMMSDVDDFAPLHGE